MKKLVLVVDHFLSRLPDDIVERGELDRVYGACLFAHATEDTTEFIDLELRGVLLTIVPGRFRSLDVDAVRGADRWAHHACNALHATRRVSIQTVDPSEVGGLKPAMLRVVVFASLLGVLERSARMSLPERSKKVTHGRPEPFDDAREVDRLGCVHRGGFDRNDVFVADRHTARSIAAFQRVSGG